MTPVYGTVPSRLLRSKTITCTSFIGTEQSCCEEDMISQRFSNEIGLSKGAQEVKMALDDACSAPVTFDWEFVGNNSVVKGRVAANTFDDEFLLSAKLQASEEVEVREILSS